MNKDIGIKNKKLYNKIRQLSNPSKFKIIEATQDSEINVTNLSKISKLAFNKCSNYCSELEKQNLVIKNKVGINSFVKSKISLESLSRSF
ncbi:MAG: hypothetical protein WC260_00775 [Candidatus Pacearchaeota archaeon]